MSCTVAFAGNPNVGKSTVFNALTGLRQHTGNWTGKTVEAALGRWTLEGQSWEAVDLPGIYSLEGGTPEERIAAEYLERHSPDVLVVILDATALERTLALALELRARHPRLVVCLHLMDEAERLGLRLDPEALSAALHAPVVPTRADRRESLETLRRVIAVAAMKKTSPAGRGGGPSPSGDGGGVLSERGHAASIAQQASELAKAVTLTPARPRRDWDRLFLGRWTAYPIVLALLFVLFYLTVRGANYPSELLERGLDRLGERLGGLLSGLPETLRSLLLEGLYGTTAKVVAVMLPPMAIFFPLFSLMEDLGFLPRAALLLDRPFAACGACGRQGLCMCMGLGCNAVGVTGCRIIPNERERLAAILTNALVPCNGRFPTLILLAGILLGRMGELTPAAAAGALTLCLLLSGLMTLLTTSLLRKTVLRGRENAFVLELPPFRRPRVCRLLIRSLLDRTLRVLGRAVTVAAPAGVLIWLLGRVQTPGGPLLRVLADGLDPPAALLGLTGTLLLAFLLSFPANELLLPLALLIGGAGSGGAATLPALLAAGGTVTKTALCAAVFTLFHWPCSTTLLTVWSETKSMKWTLLALLLPTATGALLCALTNLGFRLFG